MIKVYHTSLQKVNVSLAEATDIYYSSVIAKQIEAGIADLHCRSDKYLADELWLEINTASQG